MYRCNQSGGGYDEDIVDLKAKLADLEDDHNKLIDQYNKQYNDLCEEIKVHSSARERFVIKVDELKQQLAEKEKEIEEYKRICTIAHFEDLQIENMLLKRKDQDKISFSIEQLEKVKEWVNEMLNGWKTNQEVNQFARDGICLALENVGYKIDNQIKSIKEIK